MNYILSEQEKSLLSAFHDGETSATEAAEVQRLLERSPEARTWLRDARSVRSMSVEATLRVPIPLASGKLTGSAIAAAAAKKSVLSGGGFFAVARSPLGLAGAAALMIAGAIWTVNTLTEHAPSRTGGKEISAVAQQQENPAASIRTAAMSEIGDQALIVPPVTPHDLISFAVNGSLPINSERTRFVGMETEPQGGTDIIRDLEGGLGTLEQSHIRALDSLARLLRSSVVRLQGNTCAVRSDLPELRMAVISRLEKARLSEETRQQLTTARRQSEENKAQMRTSLEAEIRNMEEKLLAGGEEPYVLIELNKIAEKPTGDERNISVLQLIGPRPSIISIDPESIRIAEPNPDLSVTYAAAGSSKKRSPNGPSEADSRAASGSGTLPPQAFPNNLEWQLIATEPFMQSITISLFANEGVAIIVSDEEDTTLNSGTLFVGEKIYSFSSRLNELTARLNERIYRIAGDKSKSPEVRALEIYNHQQEYQQQVRQMLNEINNQDNVIPAPNPDSIQDNKGVNPPDPLKDATERDVREEEQPLGSNCMPWEDCTGLG